MIVDYDGRILSQADPGPGEKIVVGPIDLASLRAERERRAGHHMLAHLRMETYSGYRRPMYPAGLADVAKPLSVNDNNEVIKQAKARFGPKTKWSD